MQCLEEAEQAAESVDVPYSPLQIVNSFISIYPSAPFLNPLSSLSPPSLLSLLINFLSSLDKDFKFHYILFHQWHIFLHSVSHHDFFFNNAFYKLVKTKF